MLQATLSASLASVPCCSRRRPHLRPVPTAPRDSRPSEPSQAQLERPQVLVWVRQWAAGRSPVSAVCPLSEAPLSHWPQGTRETVRLMDADPDSVCCSGLGCEPPLDFGLVPPIIPAIWTSALLLRWGQGRAAADKCLQSGLLCKMPITHQATLLPGWAWFPAAVSKRQNPGHRHLSACFCTGGSGF